MGKKKPIVNVNSQYKIKNKGGGIYAYEKQTVVFSNGEILKIN